MTTAATPLAIGIDVGATKIAAALVSRQGEVLTTIKVRTAPQQGVEAVLDLIAKIIFTLKKQATDFKGVGLGTPGRVDPVAGTVQNAVNLGWDNVALVAGLQARLDNDLPIFIQKDANAEVLGEAYFGAGQGCENLVYIGLGSGLGGGAIINGQLVLGDNLTASEVGHLSLDPAGRRCGCGQRGCAETIASGNGVVALAREYLIEQQYAPTSLREADLTSEAIITAGRANDPLAAAVLDQAAHWLGQIIAMYATLLNPARIVIGGGFGRAAFDLLLPGVMAAVGQYALPMSHRHLEIVPSQLASSAVGASCLVWYALEDKSSKRLSVNSKQ